MIKKIIVLVFLFVILFANAQEAIEPQMADGMRTDGKIYVVIGVMLTIFVCVVLYLVRIDKKVKKLEDEIKNQK